MFVIIKEYEGLLRDVYYTSLTDAIKAAEKSAGFPADVVESDYAQVGDSHIIELKRG